MLTSIISYLESHQPIATVLTGVLAVLAVVGSQIWFDYRQRKEHRHSYEMKANERLLSKKEDLIETISMQIQSISEVEGVYDLWHEDFKANYSYSRINALLREVDTRLSKIHLLVKEYFPSFIRYIDKITVEAQGFHELCADFAMAGRFGQDDFYNLNHIEIVDACNSYAVAYMQLSALLVERKETQNPFLKKEL